MEKPYIEIREVKIKLTYNPNYGDNRVCVCGHEYYRHFDTYEDMNTCGCKYCGCNDFLEDVKENDMNPDFDHSKLLKFYREECNRLSEENSELKEELYKIKEKLRDLLAE